ncbi:carbohydrate ABC transporter permease [Pararhizobium sp.]|uniref:carbohydrate ABC transporter permease n=1 Tax=Pararhizobium sp. TaxID=1977563 RepID=UPI002721DFA8|nr:carbohydrate ABC transporter permease [Pararhizobium sp.]MDO9417763.1 carbohydrate ABC transporter permease [Pararhizobium sp.]
MTTGSIASSADAPSLLSKLFGPKQNISWGNTAILAAGSLFILLPLYFVLAMSLKSSADMVDASGFEWPTTFHWSNYAAAWEMVNAPVALFWSVVITALSIAGNILIPAMVAWAVVRNWSTPLFRYAFIYLLATMFIPFTVLALPQIKLMASLGLDNPFGVVILNWMFGLSFNTLMFAAYIRALPSELEESAILDGCSTFEVFWKIVLPLLTPMAATVGIFAFLQSWNDFMMPSLIISSVSQQTLPVVQATFRDTLTLNYNVAFASYAIAMIPAIIGYVIGQRWIIAGVMRGAIK